MIETCVVEELPARPRPGPGGAERTYLLTGGTARCGVCSQPLEAKPAATPHECARCGHPIRRRKGKNLTLADIAKGVDCEGCGHKLEPKPSRPATRGYACTKTAPHPGCGKVRIAAGPLEDDVAFQVLTRYSHPESVQLLAAQVQTSAQTGRALAVEIGATEEQIRLIARQRARGELGETAFKTLESEYEAQLREMRRQAASTMVIDSFTQMETVDDLTVWWQERSTVQERHELVRALLDEVRIMPSRRRGFRGFDQDRVVYVWAAG